MAETNGRYEATGNEIVHDDTTPGEVDPNTPSYITPKARSIIYISSLGTTVVTGLATGVAVIVGGITEDQATDITTLVFGAIALVNTSLGVAFRPTRPALIGAKRG